MQLLGDVFAISEEGSYRCQVCFRSNWIKKSNAILHAKTMRHKAAVRAKAWHDKNNVKSSNEVQGVQGQHSSSVVASLGLCDSNAVTLDSTSMDELLVPEGCTPEIMDEADALVPDMDCTWTQTPFVPDDSLPEALPLAPDLCWMDDVYFNPTGMSLTDVGGLDDVSEHDLVPGAAEWEEVLEDVRPNSILTLTSADYDLAQGDWAPYPSKAMFLTDMLFNSRELRFSSVQKEAILQWARDLGAPVVPSLKSLNKIQHTLSCSMGLRAEEKLTRDQDIYYMNDVGKILAMDMANPLVRPYMRFYPEESSQISETWHGNKWLRDLPDDLLTPMAIHPTSRKHYYVNELCRATNGKWFIPKRWVVRNRELGAYGFGVIFDQNSGFTVLDSSQAHCTLAELEWTYEDLVREFESLDFTDVSKVHEQRMPNPRRLAADGRPVYAVPLILFIDDVSANISKQWNKNYVVYMSNATLPREHLDEQYNVHFIAASPSAAPLELMAGVCETVMNCCQSGVTAIDCLNEVKGESVLLPLVYFIAGDNPMQAELASQCGLKANKFCRTCNVGGPQVFKRSDEGYLTLFQSGDLRTPQETCVQIGNQFEQVLLSTSRAAMEKLVRSSGIKDSIAQPIIDYLFQYGDEVRRAYPQGIPQKDYRLLVQEELRRIRQDPYPTMNSLLTMPGVDVHQDTPTELLHTILLGVVKYFWGQTVYTLIKSKKFDIFEARLDSVNTGGLNIPRIMASYMCQYRSSLIGKHFKTIVQVIPFAIDGIVGEELAQAWLYLGRLVVLCWFTDIDDMEVYLHELQDVIDQFLTVSANCAPSIILSKPKFHFLVHLPLFIRRFGPALLFATERYESYNSVFRAGCIFSNRQAPSRDSALTFLQLARIRHICSGGTWVDAKTRKLVRASNQVLQTIIQNRAYSKLVGFPLRTTPPLGSYKIQMSPVPGNATGKQGWLRVSPSTLLPELLSNPTDGISESMPLFRCREIVAQSGDKATAKSCVLVRKDTSLFIGIIQDILTCHGAGTLEVYSQHFPQSPTMVVIRRLELEQQRHPRLNMPQVTITSLTEYISPEMLVCTLNIQHNCSRSGCLTDGTRSIFQERKQTNKHKCIVQHRDEKYFILNAFALHNHRFLAEYLPNGLLRCVTHCPDLSQARLAAARKVRDKNQQAQEDRKMKDLFKIMKRDMPPGAAVNSTLAETSDQATDGVSDAREKPPHTDLYCGEPTETNMTVPFIPSLEELRNSLTNIPPAMSTSIISENTSGPPRMGRLTIRIPALASRRRAITKPNNPSSLSHDAATF